MNTTRDTVRLTTPCDFEHRTATTWKVKVIAGLDAGTKWAEIDMSHTRSMDSSGLTALLAINEVCTQNQGQVRLINPSSVVTQLLELTRMHRVFVIAKGTVTPTSGADRPILIAEDESLILSVATLSLKPLGRPIITAVNGLEASDLAQRDHPALILLDYIMPLMDGTETLRRLKSDDSTKDIPVIIMSANEKIARGAYENFEGASCFITKPFSPAALRSEVHRLIQENMEVAAV